MTSIALTDRDSGAITAEDKDGKNTLITSRKTATKYWVRKIDDGFIFFHITVDEAALPEALEGKFSSRQAAIDTLVKYIKNKPMTRAAATKIHREERVLRRAAELRSSSN